VIVVCCKSVGSRLLRSQQPLSALPERDRWLSYVLSMLLAARCILNSHFKPFEQRFQALQTGRCLFAAAATAVAPAAPAVVMERGTGPHDLGGLSPGMSLCPQNLGSCCTAAITAALSYMLHARRTCVCNVSAVLVPPYMMRSRFLMQHTVQIQTLQQV
jgi:hypothetical protein